MTSTHPTTSIDAANAEDALWWSRVPRNRAGKLLHSQVASLELRLTSDLGWDAPVACCVDTRRTFLLALLNAARRGAPPPCGLPSTLPKYVAIANLSGERVMVYSEKPTLMRKLCSCSSAMHSQELRLNIERFVSWIEQQRSKPTGDDSFVLISFQLPWQLGIESLHWEINTVVLQRGSCPTDVTLCDRALLLTGLSPRGVVLGQSTTMRELNETCAPAVGDDPIPYYGAKHIATLRENYSATCLDHDSDDEAESDGTTGDAATGATNAAASKSKGGDDRHDGIMRAMLQDRKSMQEEVATLKRENLRLREAQATADAQHEKTLTAELATLAKTHETELGLVKAQRDEKQAELDGTRATTAELLRKVEKLEHDVGKAAAALKKVKSDGARQNDLSNKSIQRGADDLKACRETLKTAKAEHEKQLAEAARERTNAVERVEADARRTRELLQAKVKEKERFANQLAEINDVKDAQVVSLRADLADLTKERGQQTAEAKRAAEELTSLRATLEENEAETATLRERAAAAALETATAREAVATAEAKRLQLETELVEARARVAQAELLAAEATATATKAQLDATDAGTGTDAAASTEALPDSMGMYRVRTVGVVTDTVGTCTQEHATTQTDPEEDDDVAGSMLPSSPAGPMGGLNNFLPAQDVPSMHALNALHEIQYLLQFLQNVEHTFFAPHPTPHHPPPHHPGRGPYGGGYGIAHQHHHHHHHGGAPKHGRA